MKQEKITLEIGKPAIRALQAVGIETMEQLTQFSEKELLALHGFGPKALGVLKIKLSEHGLFFKD